MSIRGYYCCTSTLAGSRVGLQPELRLDPCLYMLPGPPVRLKESGLTRPVTLHLISSPYLEAHLGLRQHRAMRVATARLQRCRLQLVDTQDRCCEQGRAWFDPLCS